MAIQPLYPSSRPTLNLHFAKVKALDPRITFARASGAAYYDGKTVAKAEENLFLQSQTMTTSPWVVVNASTTGSKTAPNGTSTAIEISATSTNGRTQQLVTIVSGLTHTLSMFVRRVTGVGDVRLIIADSSGNSLFTTIMSLTADWQRFTVSGAPTITSISCRVVVDTSGDEVEIWGAQFEQRDAVTAYTATTTQPITQFQPVLLSESANVARFDHDPITGESLGLLIEEQRTNLLLRSEEFDDAGWTKVGGTVTANTIVAPDGTLTGDKLVEDTATGEHRLFQAHSFISGTPYTFSVFVKASERTLVHLTSNNTTTYTPRAFFDVSAGVVTSTVSGTASITDVGNGWYRCAVSGVAGQTATTGLRVMIVNTGATISYTGDGFSGIFLWGASLEQGAFPTSYVKTTTAQVTRAADAASMTGANFSSWYNAAEGTLYAESSRPFTVPSGRFPAVFSISDGTTGNDIRISYITAAVASFSVTRNLANQVNFTPTTSAVVRTMSGAYKVNDFAASLNGATVLTSSAGLIPEVNQATFGTRLTGNHLNGHIRKISYYPQRLANVQLQSLTK